MNTSIDDKAKTLKGIWLMKYVNTHPTRQGRVLSQKLVSCHEPHNEEAECLHGNMLNPTQYLNSK